MPTESRRNQEPAAIVGMACIFPKAPDLRTFWNNILNGVNAVSDPSPDWEAGRYLESGMIHTPFGGYLRDLFCFDPKEFGIMPNSVDGGEPDQFLALRVARDALADAGYLDSGYDHSDTGIVLGHSTYLHRGQVSLVQHTLFLDQTMALLQSVKPDIDGQTLGKIRELLEKKLPPCNADIVPGLVPNVMTGRIANRLNLKGPNYLIDAACASSLLAVNAAIDELHKGNTRMMLAGGVNASLPAEVSVIFTQLGALSRKGRVRPFEKGSDGTLLGEGLGVVVLKRLSDAVADQDRIYAVIRGVGKASDGRAQGLLAPSVHGETLSLERAYAECDVDPESIGLIEAHGTGIPLGDQTEIAALKQVFGERKRAQGHIPIGSVKSMISHCIPAAGIAGLIKAAMALHHKILPPTLCETVNPDLGIEKTPFYVNTVKKPWICMTGTLRRAGVNAFGFGGINAHAILEEAPQQAAKPPAFSAWPVELCVFSAQTVKELISRLVESAETISKDAGRCLFDLAAALLEQDTGRDHRLAIMAKDIDDLTGKIKTAVKRLEKNEKDRWATRTGIVYSGRPVDGKLAFMFPGEGSQYLNMFADLAIFFETVRSWFDFWSGLYLSESGETRTDVVFPPEEELTDHRRKALERRLYDMDVGSEAVFVAGQAMNDLLNAFGVHPDVMVGHSSGESSALAASGAIAADDFSSLGDFIRRLNQVYRRVLADQKIPKGVLLAVGALSRSVVENQMAALKTNVVIAMDNCTNQLVLFGDRTEIESLKHALSDAGGICLPLPFDRGYHTPWFQAVSDAFLAYYETIGVKAPAVPMYSCASAELFPEDGPGVRALAAGQWAKKVCFRETVLNMYRDGVRYFVEVGPSGNLTAFVNDILHKKEVVSLASNQRNRDAVSQFLTVMAHLYVNQKPVSLDRLFASRRLNRGPDLQGEQTKAVMPLKNTLPVIHIDEADHPVLRQFLAVSDGQKAPPDDEWNASSVDEWHLSSVSESSEFADHCHMMTGHFDLMSRFLESQQMVLAQWHRSQPVTPDDVTGSAPFLSVITQMDEHRLEAQCRLCVHEDNFLKDHILSGAVSGSDARLKGLSCVPLMVSLEMMAEACALLAGNPAVKSIEQVKAFSWITLDDDELDLRVCAELMDAVSKTYRAGIYNADSLVVSAMVLFSENSPLDPLPALIDGKPFQWQGKDIYRVGMFHGPIFQSIAEIDGWDGQGIDASLSEVRLTGFFDDDDTPDLILNPVLLDAAGQLAACWTAQQVGTDFNCFPVAIERIALYDPCPQSIAGLKLRARQHPLDPLNDRIDAARGWQFECVDSNGTSVFAVKNLENVYFPVPHRFYQFRRDPLNGRLGYRVDIGEHKQILVWQIPHLNDQFCSQSDSIFLRILAHAILGWEERDEWQKLSGPIRYKREWLLGRACVKEAVRFWILGQTGALLYPSDIIVGHDAQGAPHVDGWWKDRISAAPGISLSHDHRLSMAAVTSPGLCVGVDVEHMDKKIRQDLMTGFLTPQEKQWLNGFTGLKLTEKLLCLWCIKEAAGKFLGTGFQGKPDLLEVCFVDDKWKHARVDYNGAIVQVMTHIENERIVAIAAAHSE